MREYEKENVIEFLNTDETATVTASRERLKNRLRRLAAERPDECEIVHENDDGSILAHVPARWVRISPPRKAGTEMTEERREFLLQILAKGRETRRLKREAAAVKEERLED